MDHAHTGSPSDSAAVSPSDSAAVSPSDAAAASPSDSAAVRRRNLGLVLRHIAAHGPCARTEVATATGLAHGSVTALAGDLVERGLVREDDALRSGGRGRPGRPLRLAPRRALSVAVQISSEQLRVVVADLAGAVLWRETALHNCAPGTPEAMADAVAAAVHRAEHATLTTNDRFAAAKRAGERDTAHSADAALGAIAVSEPARGAGAETAAVDSVLVRVVIAMAGPVRDDAAQTVVMAPDFGWLQPVRLGALVAGRLPGMDCPVDVINDGNAAAFAEYHARPRRRGLVLIEAGTGIGGGVVLDGRIQIGSHGIAGEPGHMPVALDGPPCVCGARACLVLYAGPEAVLTAAGLGELLIREGLHAASTRLIEALRAGDEQAVAAVRTAGQALGVVILSVTALLDVDEIVLGGLLAHWFPWLAPTIDEQLAGRRVLAPGLQLTIAPAVLGEDAMLLGAIEFARRTVLSDPASVPLRPLPTRT
ncbi:MAG: family transcriptional regulator [Nocardia sp.]|uniref:ROK family transcriptional regulator n=1 Tax=Nocardia sp. TaxID=1821 RepID=UPI0026291A3A|nr:ROK family transcriptional regulator [Nocardia sp.]MCU1645099.1 family transcriptional regulator [Nocardia sp.]